jgi:RNA polymerase primary sigma factor
MSNIGELHAAYVADPTPANLGAVVTALEPLIQSEISRYQGSRHLLRIQARKLAVNAIRTYDPAAGAKLTTWVVNGLQPLTRYGRRMTQGIRVPELVTRQAAEINAVRQRLIDDTGAEPSDEQLADAIGIPVKRIKHIQATAVPTTTEGFMEDIRPEEFLNDPVNPDGDPRLGAATSLVLDGLDEQDRKIFDWKTGRGGVQRQNQDIAAELGVSPAYISQRSNTIADQIINTVGNV